MALADCHLVNLPKIVDARGNLSFIEGERHIPFAIKRIFYIYDVPGGAERGAHAHRRLQQFVIAMSGSFDVVLDDGTRQQRFHLNRSYYGLYIAPMTWGYLDNFSTGSVALVLASEHYDETDYIRSYGEFLWSVKGKRES